jgi:hypothetical protein
MSSGNQQLLIGGGGLAFTAITATGGTITDITIDGKSYRRHVFTSPGTFTVTDRGSSTSNDLDILLVAGGGSGGVDNGGGGGAGGVIDTTVVPSVTSFPISIGAGAAARAGSADDGPGNPGNNSTAFSLTALGGGAGTGWQNPGTNGTPGGSGAGNSASDGGILTPVAAGTATQPGSPSGGFGNPGGTASATPAGGGSGGGGGAGGAGSGGSTGLGGAPRAVIPKYGPGIGYSGSFGTGIAGGGGGGQTAGRPNASNNGVSKSTSSGPGPTGPLGTLDENDCLANSGSGGHGSNHPNNLSSGAGGPGICVIRYKLEV